jgi:hypothetical protein
MTNLLDGSRVGTPRIAVLIRDGYGRRMQLSAPSPFTNLVLQLVDSAGAGLFDPAPIVFTAANEKGVRPVRQLVTEQRGRASLSRAIPRNSFLCGCLDVTETETIEHLLVGFGTKKGSTTLISEMHHVRGGTHSVSVPRAILDQAEAHLSTSSANEVLVFHNHPPSPIGAVMDEPLPSSQDRSLLLARRYLRPFVALKELSGGGTLRFYLGECGFVREFRTPGLLQLAAHAKRWL